MCTIRRIFFIYIHAHIHSYIHTYLPTYLHTYIISFHVISFYIISFYFISQHIICYQIIPDHAYIHMNVFTSHFFYSTHTHRNTYTYTPHTGSRTRLSRLCIVYSERVFIYNFVLHNTIFRMYTYMFKLPYIYNISIQNICTCK